MTDARCVTLHTRCGWVLWSLQRETLDCAATFFFFKWAKRGFRAFFLQKKSAESRSHGTVSRVGKWELLAALVFDARESKSASADRDVVKNRSSSEYRSVSSLFSVRSCGRDILEGLVKEHLMVCVNRSGRRSWNCWRFQYLFWWSAEPGFRRVILLWTEPNFTCSCKLGGVSACGASSSSQTLEHIN